MAGLYPDAPGHRLVLDKDGTGLYSVSSTSVSTLLATMGLINDESDGTGIAFTGVASKYAVLLFPEKRDLAGYFIYVAPPSSGTLTVGIDTSVNTTNGVDGTWVSLVSPALVVANNAPFGQSTVSYRDGIQAAVRAGIKGLRISVVPSIAANPATLATVHLYGSISAGQVLDRLAIWDPILDQPVGPAYFDWGDTPRGSSMDRPFRVKNLSATLTANTVVVSTDALSDTVPSVPGQHLLSENASAFAATVSIPSLLAGQISGVVTLRRVTPADAVLSLWCLRLIAAAQSWA
jgi:hypothetical protein